MNFLADASFITEKIEREKDTFVNRLSNKKHKQKFLRNFEIEEFDKFKPINEQYFSKIKFTKGDDAFKVFNKLNKQKGEKI